MRTLVAEYWSQLRSSYWFIPSLMAISAIVLSVVVIGVDNRLGVSWVRNFSWLYANQPDGARAVLSTVAGSMITVAGVTFSMTLLAVSHASSQMGPRLLASFMRDTGNQVTLGTFIATFVYCLLILRTVRSGVEGEDTETISPFVPHLGVILALVLAVCSVAVLIYFIHHVPRTISVTHVVDRTGDELLERIDHLYPQRIGEGGEAVFDLEPQLSALEQEGHDEVRAQSKGHLRRVHGEDLLELAAERDLVLALGPQPGEFVSPGTVLLRVWPRGALDDDFARRLRDRFIFGAERSLTQDLLFTVDQLIEVATRALSPGVNDPFTAMECINQLEAGLVELAGRAKPQPHRVDEEGRLRVVARGLDFCAVANHTLDRLHSYVASDAMVSLHLLRSLEHVGDATPSSDDLEALRRAARHLATAASSMAGSEYDKERIEAAYAAVAKSFRRHERVLLSA